MPAEPRSPGWAIPDVRTMPAGQELVAVGAELSAGMLLAGYRQALFGMPDGDILGWWSPDPRGILLPARVHASRSLRRALGRFEVGVDSCFDTVVAHCADPSRPHGWISADYRAAYHELHVLGWAHSIEVWDADGALAGGLFGVEVGGLLAAESMFHVATDASKVAVVALADLLAADRRPERLVDIQWCTPHLASLGAIEVSRPDYLQRLGRALALPPVLGGQGEVVVPGPSRIRWRTA